MIESGLGYTILNPSMFMQNVAVEWPSIAQGGVYSRPYSTERKMSRVDTDDLGEAAAIVLTEDGYAGATFELCGPDSLSHAEMAKIWSQVLGRDVAAEKRSLDDWQVWARGRGWAEWSIAAYVEMCDHYDAHGYPGGNPLVLGTILGREPGGYRAFADRFAAEMNKD